MLLQIRLPPDFCSSSDCVAHHSVVKAGHQTQVRHCLSRVVTVMSQMLNRHVGLVSRQHMRSK